MRAHRLAAEVLRERFWRGLVLSCIVRLACRLLPPHRTSMPVIWLRICCTVTNAARLAVYVLRQAIAVPLLVLLLLLLLATKRRSNDPALTPTHA